MRSKLIKYHTDRIKIHRWFRAEDMTGFYVEKMRKKKIVTVFPSVNKM